MDGILTLDSFDPRQHGFFRHDKPHTGDLENAFSRSW